jgi:hypothetical protein
MSQSKNVSKPAERVAKEALELKPALSLPAHFEIREVAVEGLQVPPRPVSPPSLGPLAAFTGVFKGKGFNTIFRPDSLRTPTQLPTQVGGDNVLELNLTEETLSFSPSLGAVPNRGTGQEADRLLNGVPYLQAITDVTVPAQPTGIHLEPGLWIIVPPTTIPSEGVTLARMASIPHGTTIIAQGISSAATHGPPTIPVVNITPFTTPNPSNTIPPHPNFIRFPSQTATNQGTARMPQDLTSFIAAETITQAMLDDPNTVLRNAIAHQTITSTTTVFIDTNPANPLFGGGPANIAFLLGNAAATTPNAQTTRMQATFWIETVAHTILVPALKAGEAFTLHPEVKVPRVGAPLPVFTGHAPTPIPTPRPITVHSTQIQYSQVVFLNFNGLTWPHVSVATLVPAGPIPVPPAAWGP